MGKRPVPIPVVFGTRPGKKKYVWGINTYNMRVFYDYENTNIEELAAAIDDWLGDAPKGAVWYMQAIGNKRCRAIVERVNKLWEANKQEDE